MKKSTESKLRLIYEEVRPLIGSAYYVKNSSMRINYGAILNVDTGNTREVWANTRVKTDVLKNKYIITSGYVPGLGDKVIIINPDTLDGEEVGDKYLEKTNALLFNDNGKMGLISISGSVLFPAEAERIVGVSTDVIGVTLPRGNGSYLVDIKNKSYNKISADIRLESIEKSGNFLKIRKTASASAGGWSLFGMADMQGRLLTPIAFIAIKKIVAKELGIIMLISPYSDAHRVIADPYGILTTDGEYLGGAFGYFEQIAWLGKGIAGKIPRDNPHDPSSWWALDRRDMLINHKLRFVSDSDLYSKAKEVWVRGQGYIKGGEE